MKYALAFFALCWIGVGSAIPNLLQAPHQAPPDYRFAYDRWRHAIDSNPMLGEAFWVSPDSGPPELRSAVTDLLSIGPNLTSLLVAEMRREKDQLHVYQLVCLLEAVSGINLYFGSGEENYYAAMPRFKERFIQDWDSGMYLNATSLLEATWTDRNESRPSEEVDPDRLTQVRRYGVFAIPFIIERLEQRNSPELFAAFLIITGDARSYSDYLKKPAEFLPERGQKLSYVKAWADKNQRRLDQLEGLPQKIKALMNR